MLTMKHYTIPIFVPEIACPFQCVFCNQEKISGQCSIPNSNEIVNTIEIHLASFKNISRHVEVGFFGGSFTGIPLDEQKRYLDIVQPYVKSGSIHGVRLSTRPDYINEEILNLLKEHNVTTIELGAQSFDSEVLKKSRRGHTVEDIINASALIRKHGFKLGLQMMVGLPGDTLEKSVFTAQQIIKHGSGNTRIYPAVVIRDTVMHSWYKQGKYKPLKLPDAVNQVSVILPLFEEAGVNVIRVGLHPSEGLMSGKELVDGPFHSSFKELVLTEIWKNILVLATDKCKNKNFVISVQKEELNYVIGYKSSNRNMLNKKFAKVQIIADSTLKNRNFIIH
jgi:histone acetyltransferase (RNA polymerase elongator complex component)